MWKELYHCTFANTKMTNMLQLNMIVGAVTRTSLILLDIYSKTESIDQYLCILVHPITMSFLPLQKQTVGEAETGEFLGTF